MADAVIQAVPAPAPQLPSVPSPATTTAMTVTVDRPTSRNPLEYLLDNPLLIAALLGAIVTITVARTTLHGVKLSLKEASNRSTKELLHAAEQAVLERQHSADEAQKERITEIRRNVYLAAIDEIIKLNIYLAGLPKLNVTNIKVEESMMGLSNKANQIAAVGDLETAIMARQLLSDYGQIFIKALTKMAPRHNLQLEKNMHDDRLSHLSPLIDTNRQDLQELRERRPDDNSGMSFLEQQFMGLQQHKYTAQQKILELNTKMSEFDIEFGDFVLSEFHAITDKLDDLLNRIREELGLESDVERFRAQALMTRQTIDAAMKEMKLKLGVPA